MPVKCWHRQTPQKIKYGRAVFQITLGAILLRQEKLDAALAVLTSEKLQVPVKDLPHLLTQLGYVFERKGQLSKAADYALEALHLCDTLLI